MVSRRRALRVSGKFYIFVILIAAAVLLGAWLLLRTDTAQARQGSLDFETRLPAVIVRDETIVTSENFEKVNFLVPDQQRVEADSPVAEIFKWGYNERVMNDLIDARTRIQEYERQASVAAQDLASLNEQISLKSGEIREIAQGGEGDFVRAERELRGLIEQRRQLLEDEARSDAQLEALRSQEQQLADRVNSWREISNSPSAGVVSYYYDGYESVLNASNIRNVTSEVIGALLNGSLRVRTEETGARPLYRLVNNFNWYAVVDPGRQILEFANENVFSVTFDEYPERSFEGRVVGNVAEGTRYLYVFEFTEDIGALVNARRATATFRASFDGLVVPEAALTEENGATGVAVMEDRRETFVPVTVRIVKDEEAVVVPPEGSALRNGSRVALK